MKNNDAAVKENGTLVIEWKKSVYATYKQDAEKFNYQ